MSMNLKQITRILVQFSPLAGNGASAREFLARIVCAQSSNPDCKIEQKVRYDKFLVIDAAHNAALFLGSILQPFLF